MILRLDSEIVRLVRALAKTPCEELLSVTQKGDLEGFALGNIFGNKVCGKCEPCKARVSGELKP